MHSYVIPIPNERQWPCAEHFTSLPNPENCGSVPRLYHEIIPTPRGGYEGPSPAMCRLGQHALHTRPATVRNFLQPPFSASGRLSTNTNSRSNMNVIILIRREDYIPVAWGRLRPRSLHKPRLYEAWKKYFAFWIINLGSVPLRTTFLVAMK